MSDDNTSKNDKTLPKEDKADYIVAFLSLIFITIYAPFTIAALLEARFPMYSISALVFLIFMSMAIGTLISAMRTGMGLIVAPAVGMATFVSQTSPKTVSTAQLLVAAIIAGLIAVVLSVRRAGQGDRSLRQRFVDSIPAPVKVGVRGGVGTLLAATAIRPFEELHTEIARDPQHIQAPLYQWVVPAFVLGVVLLLLAEIAQRNLRAGRGITLLFRSASFLVPLVLFIFLDSQHVFPSPQWVSSPQLPSAIPLFDLHMPSERSETLPNIFNILCFSGIILFVFVTDIPGSPYDLLGMSDKRDARAVLTIDRSFLVTSLMSMINPFVGLFTSVYYAENHAAISDEKTQRVMNRPYPAYLCSAAFLGLAILALFVDFHIVEMRRWLLIAVSPALFCLGVRLTARAIEREAAEALEQMRGPRISSYFVPISLTVILTHFIGFEIALPLGVCYYALYGYIAGDQQGLKGVTLLVLCSAAIALFLGLISLGYG